MKYLIPFFILVHTLCADSPTTDNSYILEPFDFIRVELFQEPDMTTETEINAQGLISLPLINSISISNLPIAQARKKIAQAYIDQKFLINPQVNIIVLEHVERKVMVLGQVNSPGSIVIPPSQKTLSITEAISGAKGLNLRANASGIQLTTSAPNGAKITSIINFNKILKDPNFTGTQLKNGDTVFVPESLF